MNLIHGKQMDAQQARRAIDKINESILQSLASGRLAREAVVAACDALSKKLNEQEHLPLLLSLGMNPVKAKAELETVRRMLSREYLESRIEREFGDWSERTFQPVDDDRPVRQVWEPLGVLLHIAAGNADALPTFSVIEGLLTENVNILKLPGGGDELSIRILTELITIEPRIAEKTYVFDVPSGGLAAMEHLAGAADAIVVWGGDAAVRAVRQMAKPDTRIIEWGHKISFAYVSGDEAADNDLLALARHICETNQLFCSSCQGIFLDTNSFETLVAFAERFFALLEEAAAVDPLPDDPFRSAQTTLALYTEELEAVHMKKRVFRGKHCGVVAYGQGELTPSYLFRSVWVRPLPKERILRTLKPYKNHLQTVGLICNAGQKRELEEALVAAGVVRVTSCGKMSSQYCGMPHDGEFALRRYMKTVSVES
jgi:acyl-CoA reductase-like NAD-dependent aldehyde dehydrogenase